METSLPVALSGQIAMEKRLETLAHNIANARTVGFRAEEVRFEELLSRTGPDPVSFVSSGATYLSNRTGALTQTGNPLDLAVRGEAFFAFQGDNGPVYTRDGRMQVSPEGTVQTLTGKPLLDAGGATVQIDPAGGPLTIGGDGRIHQAGQQIGAIGLFRIPAGANVTRHDTSGVVSDVPAVPVIEFLSDNILQGYVEEANVNPIHEITRLITLQRAFESAANVVQTNDRSLGDAIKSLGSNR
ncbi:flagellar basal-body rod protein FlgF [Fulvimarina sp. 2208YS6-2-32]|uniref:Flagellar basal-body rod protein FlgF n=1 Tax=Fulvimarina uroteuthidis TaxID=3098149 RepID=A0ABU5I0Q4_9HYPH|nr:flagellar basal-body rod protein FlgF [Fulvimarina sp. 2208YS6-2-32]MDY8108922.1 flagellar basal-body rod protein FlgF [Fulvimarina sp. 2208YS6-2-32]